jgi:hypothetical protein
MRIRARKVVLTYFYWRIFVLRACTSTNAAEQISHTIHMADSELSNKEIQEWKDDLMEQFDEDPMDSVLYVVQEYFDNW